MILGALTEFYEALEAKGKAASEGWSPAKISFALNLDDDGQVLSVSYLCEEIERGKKKAWVPREMAMPTAVKRSSGVNANFLWDNSSYILGVDGKGNPKRAKECFEACREKHIKILNGIDDDAALAILHFFLNWEPEKYPEASAFEGYGQEILGGGNLTFRYKGQFVSEADVIKKAWMMYQTCGEQTTEGVCLVTGEKRSIARLHPVIKGIPGAQSSGASLVSFNAEAYNSYGKEQGGNAPVSEYAAFAYTSALNYLINDYQHRQILGDTVLVYWVKEAETSYQDLFSFFMNGGNEKLSEQKLSAIMASLAQGKAVEWNTALINPDQEFFILGISPNAARLAVRMFCRNTFGNIAKNVKNHYDNLSISHGDKQPDYITPWRLLNETANPNSRDKKISPQLSGDLMRSILEGLPYPETLYSQILLRIRADHTVSYGRAAFIKAYLLRNAKNIEKEVLTVKLNEENRYTPYVLGRLFAELEGLQEAANPGINATIRDRYFNSACATPAVVFPVLIKLAQNHLRKLDGGLKHYYEKQLENINSLFDEAWPERLSLKEQGVFQLGYYHQKTNRFKGKKKEEEK